MYGDLFYDPQDDFAGVDTEGGRYNPLRNTYDNRYNPKADFAGVDTEGGRYNPLRNTYDNSLRGLRRSMKRQNNPFDAITAEGGLRNLPFLS